MTEPRRFPPPWSVDDPDPQLERQCFIIRDHKGQALAYVYCEDEPRRRSAAHLLTARLPGASTLVVAVNHAHAPGRFILQVVGSASSLASYSATGFQPIPVFSESYFMPFENIET